MEKPAVVNGDQFPPAYNPAYTQPPTYGEETGISTISHSGYNVGTEAGMPPEYTQSFEDVNCFSEASVRRGFIKKVYITLMVQLLITVGIICAFLYCNALKLWVLHTSWFAYTMMGTTIVLVIVLSCCGDIRRKVPLNFIFLGLFTVAEGMLLGSVTVSHQTRCWRISDLERSAPTCPYMASAYNLARPSLIGPFRFFNAEAVLWAVGATAFVSFGLSLFAMQSKWDFTRVSGCLWVLCWTLFSFGLLCAIMRSEFLYIAYASLGTLLFSVYLVMDTHLMLAGKHKYTVSAEEYIFTALNLYLDIVTLFLMILKLFGLCR